ncbi:MAG: pyridoxine 5'-phosphate synthase, partial [Bacteroidaceae bacterium]|nr:pyridoxine 5'-phosphate synthase [Bacteroidaceae bacterium]
VNINKIATLRNARGGNNPDVLQVALDCERFGAQGITVHPRPDERHIRRQDVFELKPRLSTEFNIEGYPSPEFIDLVLQVAPAQVTLVPDSPDQLTSNHGWNTQAHLPFLTELTERFHGRGIRVSIFVDADETMVDYAAESGADRVELYTEPYATLYPKDREEAIAPFVRAGERAVKRGLGLNMGHDLSLENLRYMHECMPYVAECSIGHALVCDALYLGLEETIRRYRECLA